MNKKKLVTTFGSLALVGAIGVGATLAYLSDQTNTITNTFTVGNNISVQISEKDIDGSGRIQVTDEAATQDYGQLVAGKAYDKDPRVDLLADSPASYLYIYVSGVDALKSLDLDGKAEDTTFDFEVIHNEQKYVFDSNWKKIADVNGGPSSEGVLDGIYVWTNDGTNPVSVDAGTSTSSLFDQIKIADDVTSYKEGAAALLTNSKITLKAAAIQADNNTSGAANTSAISLLKN